MGIFNAVCWNWDRIVSLRSSWVYREKNQNAKNKNKLKTQRIFNWLSVRENGDKRWEGKHLIRRSHMWCCQLIKKEVACSCSTLWWRTERGGTILNSWTLCCRRNIPQSSYFHPETLGNCNWWKHTHVVTKIRFKIVSSINHTMTPTAMLPLSFPVSRQDLQPLSVDKPYSSKSLHPGKWKLKWCRKLVSEGKNPHQIYFLILLIISELLPLQ